MVVRISNEAHRKLKIYSAEQGVSMTEVLNHIIAKKMMLDPDVPLEDKVVAQKYLRSPQSKKNLASEFHPVPKK